MLSGFPYRWSTQKLRCTDAENKAWSLILKELCKEDFALAFSWMRTSEGLVPWAPSQISTCQEQSALPTVTGQWVLTNQFRGTNRTVRKYQQGHHTLWLLHTTQSFWIFSGIDYASHTQVSVSRFGTFRDTAFLLSFNLALPSPHSSFLQAVCHLTASVRP